MYITCLRSNAIAMLHVTWLTEMQTHVIMVGKRYIIHACIYSESAELHCHDYLLVMHLCYYQVFIVAVEIESVDHGTPMLPGKYFFHFMNIVKWSWFHGFLASSCPSQSCCCICRLMRLTQLWHWLRLRDIDNPKGCGLHDNFSWANFVACFSCADSSTTLRTIPFSSR